MRLAILNQCDISAGKCAACFDLSFHLCINPLSLSILLQKASYFPCYSWISSVFCYSLWRPYLNGNSLTLTIHSCLHIYQSILSSIFYLSLLSCTSRNCTLADAASVHTASFVSKTTHKCFCLRLVTCLCSQCSFVLYPPLHTSTLPDSTAICLVIHPSSNNFPTWTVHPVSLPPEAFTRLFSFVPPLSQTFTSTFSLKHFSAT